MVGRSEKKEKDRLPIRGARVTLLYLNPAQSRKRKESV